MALGFPHSSVGKEFACNAGDPGSIPGLGRSPGERDSFPLSFCGLENFMNCIVHGVSKSLSQLNYFHFHFHMALVVKNPSVNEGDIRDVGSIPGPGRHPGGGQTLQYPCL